MNVNINFYGHAVDIDPQEVIEAAGLTDVSTKGAIRRAVNEAVQRALEEDEFPEYDHDGSDVVDEIFTILHGDDEDADE